MSLARTYDKIASDYNKTNFRPFWKKEFPIFKRLMRGRKIVDLGYGAGRDATVFLKNKFDYTGIDFSKGMLAQAKKRAPKSKFKIMDLYKLKLPAESFDGFWASASLLHIPKKRVAKVLRSMGALLKPDGVGFISLKQKRDVSEGELSQNIYGGKTKRFFVFYTRSEFEGILKQSGFKVVKFVTKYWTPDNTTWLCFFVKKN